MNTQVAETENFGMWDIRRKPLVIHLYRLNTVSEYPWYFKAKKVTYSLRLVYAMI